MFVLFNQVKYSIAQSLSDAVKSSFEAEIANAIDLKSIYDALVTPPNLDMGHLAFGAFPLARATKKAPPVIANMVVQNLKTSDLIKSATAAGPYINLFLNTSKLAELLLPQIASGAYFKTKLTQNSPKTMVEFSQPNTHKEMHVGHMRNMCLGDAIIKLQRYASIPTISTTFPGDVGTHVAKCLWYLKKHNKETPPIHRKGAWLGTLYTKGNNLLEDQKGTPAEEKNREELTLILKELEKKSGPYYELWKETRAWSVDLMQEVYDWVQIKFDVWYWESDVDSSSVEYIKKLYSENKLVMDQGAIGLDLTNDKLGFCLLLKSDGTGLYATKDVELARRKFIDHQVDKSIYVVDNRQAHHFKQVFKVLEKIGFEKARDCFHLQYEMVELPDGAMSSRKGNIVPIQKLIDEMVLKIKTDYLSRYKDEWDQKKIDDTANIVAQGAIKYGMLKMDSNKKIVFDLTEWLRLDGESGPYIQYVHARINSMLAKIDANELNGIADFSLLTHPIEEAIILKLNDFNDNVMVAASQYKTSHLTAYLYDLAKLYNSFYAECPVAQAAAPLRTARAQLSQALALTIKKGLELLGITAPNQM